MTMESKLTETYYKKLEETNQLLEAKIYMLETENKNLIAKTKELDPVFWESELRKLDITVTITYNAFNVSDMDKSELIKKTQIREYKRAFEVASKFRENLEIQ